MEDRRTALGKILLGWSALIVLPSLYVFTRYVIPPLKKIGLVPNVIVGKEEELPPNSAKIIKMGLKPVIIVHTTSGEFKAFGATCTHLGCTVEFRSDKGGYFHCNCHGGEYDLNGRNISGPPPKPLAVYNLSIKSGMIVVSEG